MASPAAQPTFEVAAIKLSRPDDRGHRWNGNVDRISIENYTLRRLIVSAYGLKSELQVMGGPKWIDHEAFDIVAKVDDEEVARLRAMNRADRQLERNRMLQALLAERFGLKVTTTAKNMPVYLLIVAGASPKLAQSSPAEAAQGDTISVNNGRMTATGTSMDEFADDLTMESETGDRVVLNRTGLAGQFDFKMTWTEDNGNGVPTDAAYPGLFTALKEQLGLELKAGKAPIPVVIVEAASEPVFD